MEELTSIIKKSLDFAISRSVTLISSPEGYLIELASLSASAICHVLFLELF